MLPFYRLYVQEETYLNWNEPDVFRCIGSYSKEGMLRKLNALKKENSNTHWAKEGKGYFPNYLPKVN